MTASFDQAATLRAWAASRTRPPGAPCAAGEPGGMPRVFAVGGGKGGVGKTVLCASLACALGRDGARVLAVDADLGLSNLDLALGAAPESTLQDVLSGKLELHRALVPAAHNVALLAGRLGSPCAAQIGAHARLRLTDAIGELHQNFDMVLIDMPSGVGEQAMHFARAAQGVVVVATPEPTSLADAYGFLKALRLRCGTKEAYLVANMVRQQADGEALYGRLAQLVERFLGIDLRFLGAVCHDVAVGRSVRARRPFVDGEPNATASLNITAIVQRLRRAHGVGLPAIGERQPARAMHRDWGRTTPWSAQ